MFWSQGKPNLQKYVCLACDHWSSTSLLEQGFCFLIFVCVFFFFCFNHWDFSDKRTSITSEIIIQKPIRIPGSCDSFLDHLSPLGVFSPLSPWKTYWLYLHLLFSMSFFIFHIGNASLPKQTSSISFYFSVVFKGTLEPDYLGSSVVL